MKLRRLDSVKSRNRLPAGTSALGHVDAISLFFRTILLANYHRAIITPGIFLIYDELGTSFIQIEFPCEFYFVRDNFFEKKITSARYCSPSSASRKAIIF